MDSEYLNFLWIGNSKSGKTKIFDVLGKNSGILLGKIKWYGPWRQYVFYPSEDTLFNTGCLIDITFFMDQLKRDREKEKIRNCLGPDGAGCMIPHDCDGDCEWAPWNGDSDA